MNYNYAIWIYKKYRLQDSLSDDFFYQISRKLADLCMKSRIDCRLVF